MNDYEKAVSLIIGSTIGLTAYLFFTVVTKFDFNMFGLIGNLFL